MDNFSSVPSWLLNQLFIKNGVFNQDRTAVVSGQDAPHTFSIDLTQRTDWEAIKKRLSEEGLPVLIGASPR